MKLVTCVLLALLPGMMLGEVMECPQRTVMENFHFSRLQGHWYIVMRNEELRNAKCHQHILRAVNDTTSAITFKYADVSEGRYNWVTSTGTIWKTDSSGKLLVTVPINDGGRARPYWILGTDYDNYAVMYSCRRDASNLVKDKVRVLSRTSSVPEASTAAVNSVLEALHVADQMFTTSHDGCPTAD